MKLTIHSKAGHTLHQGRPDWIATVWQRNRRAIRSGRVRAVLSGLQSTRPNLLKKQGE